MPQKLLTISPGSQNNFFLFVKASLQKSLSPTICKIKHLFNSLLRWRLRKKEVKGRKKDRENRAREGSWEG